MTYSFLEPVQVTLRDGRLLIYQQFGHPNGFPFLYFHSNPGSRLEAQAFHQGASQLGLKIISVDRPGVGLSQVHPERNLDTTLTDYQEVLKALDLSQVGVIGWGVGASYALLFAQQYPGLISAALVFSPLAPPEDPQMGECLHKAHASLVRAAKLGKSAYLPTYFALYSLARLQKESPSWVYKNLFSFEDLKCLKLGEIYQYLLKNQEQAYLQGLYHAALDAYPIYSGDWTYRWPTQVHLPRVHVWQGTSDWWIKPSMQDLMLKWLPEMSYHPRFNEGHFFWLKESHEIMKWAESESKRNTRSSTSTESS